MRRIDGNVACKCVGFPCEGMVTSPLPWPPEWITPPPFPLETSQSHRVAFSTFFNKVHVSHCLEFGFCCRFGTDAILPLDRASPHKVRVTSRYPFSIPMASAHQSRSSMLAIENINYRAVGHEFLQQSSCFKKTDRAVALSINFVVAAAAAAAAVAAVRMQMTV